MLAPIVAALVPSVAIGRRAAIGAASLLTAGPNTPMPSFRPAVLPAAAAVVGGVQWRIELPPQFSVSRSLSSLVRVRAETALLATDEVSGASAKLLVLPFGEQAGGSLSADEQLELARYFFSAQNDADAGARDVGAIMAASAARSPGVAAFRPQRAPQPAYYLADGRRYVRYTYTSARCAAPSVGEACDPGEALPERRTLATVTMSGVSQFRTNTERERIRELGQVAFQHPIPDRIRAAVWQHSRMRARQQDRRHTPAQVFRPTMAGAQRGCAVAACALGAGEYVRRGRADARAREREL